MKKLQTAFLSLVLLASAGCATPAGQWQAVGFDDPVCRQIGLGLLDDEEPGVKHDFIPFGVRKSCNREIMSGWELTMVEPMLSMQREEGFQHAHVSVRFTVLPDGKIHDVRIISSTLPGFYDPYVLATVQRWQVVPVSEDAKALLAGGGSMTFTMDFNFQT